MPRGLLSLLDLDCLIVIDEAYQEFRAVNFLFYSIFDWAIKQGFKIYDFGTFTVNEEPNMGLGRFKENFDASGIFRDTIELKLS